MRRQFWFRLTLTCVLAGALLPVWGWDVEHDEVAMLVGETLPAEIQSFFTFSDFGVLIAFCHYPDMTEWPRENGKRGYHSLEEIKERVGVEDAAILAQQGYKNSGWLHRERARATMMGLLARAFAKGEHTRAAFYISVLSHSVSDESALNHPPLLQFVQYSRFPGVDYALQKVEPGSKNVFGFRSDGPVVRRVREKLRNYVPHVPQGSFEAAVFGFVTDAVRQAGYAAEKEGKIAFSPRPEAEDALAELVAMQVRILVDMTATCWAHKSVDAPLPDAGFDAACRKEMDRLFSELDPAKQAVFDGIFDETLNPAQPKGVVGLVCEPYSMFARPGLSYVGRMITASAGRTLRDHGYAVKGIATRDLAKGLPPPTEMGAVMISLGQSGHLAPDGADALKRYRDAGGRLLVVGGSDPSDISGMKNLLEMRADDEVPVSRKWGIQNQDVWSNMVAVVDGVRTPLRRNPNIDGFCKPYASYAFKPGADVVPLAELDNGRTRFVVAARKGNVVWIPEYLLMPFIFSDDTTANWSAMRLDSFASRFFFYALRGRDR
ncbi:MAG: hypothetical protein KBI41_09695 [Kiritimatiellae bacterium]|nr:hypothetical protein [Kiritimatiellia bacterium]